MDFKLKVMKGKPAFATKLQKLCDDVYLHITVNDYVWMIVYNTKAR